MKRITIIGGGGTGIMMAADLSLQGHQITLFELPSCSQNIDRILKDGYVEVVGNAINGKAKIHKITCDIKESLVDAECIIVSVMAQRQETIIELMVPYLQDGQIVCFSAGNCASIILKNKLRDKKVIVGEMQGNIYPCRLLDDGKVISAFPYKDKAVAAFPARDNDAFVNEFKEIYPCYSVKNVFQATLNSPNVSIHLAASILGITKMETTGNFRLYRDGLCPSVVSLIEMLEDEKSVVMEKMGYDIIKSVDQIKALSEYDKHPGLDIFRDLEGPTDISHRYFTEDAYTGNSLLLSLAKEFNIKTPILSSLIEIVSALNKTNFYDNGRTLDYFKLSDMCPKKINDYLEKGVI